MRLEVRDCVVCGGEFKREVKRGRPPTRCPDCKNTKTSPATNPGATSMFPPSRGTKTADRQWVIDDQVRCAVGTNSAAAIGVPQPQPDAPLSSDETGPQANVEPTPKAVALADPFLSLAADVLDDLEKVRIANENRLRQLTRSTEDSDGEERGFGLDESHPDVARLAALVDALAKAEHQATLNLNRQMRKHPLGPWVKQAQGVGEKQGARLLAAIGDPYWNTLHDRPRLVSELWSYCGYGDAVSQVRKRGEKANWSADAKMRAYLVSVSIVKAGGPYREVYDKARAKYEDAVHVAECKRCGPSGKPALPGSALSDGHKHMRAVRAISKAVLMDLWREAKRIHELPGGQLVVEAQSEHAAGSNVSEPS